MDEISDYAQLDLKDLTKYSGEPHNSGLDEEDYLDIFLENFSGQF